MDPNLLCVRVGHSERSMIGLTILAFHISPLSLGIPSFAGSPEFCDEGDHVFNGDNQAEGEAANQVHGRGQRCELGGQPLYRSMAEQFASGHMGTSPSICQLH